MGTHVTKYETKDGRTHRVEEAAEKPAENNGAPQKAGADSKKHTPVTPVTPATQAQQGA